MGLRYVWDKHTIKDIVTQVPVDPNPESISASYTRGLYWAYSTAYTINNNTATLRNVTSTFVGRDSLVCPVGALYYYPKDGQPVTGTVTIDLSDEELFPRISTTEYSSVWNYYSGSEFDPYDKFYSSGNKITFTQEKGDFINTLSDNNNMYPTDGIASEYWYTYKGSDTIDPITINYDSEFIANKEIVISLNKPTPVYGGTISYFYEYDADGSGAWKTIKKTTEDSIVFLVPESVTSTLQIRVTASDDMGYTSTTPVVGPLSTVITKKDYSIRLHKKMSDNSYKTVYLETSSLAVKVGNDTLEDILTQIESDIAALKG